jgi:hypothetical protein
LQPSSDTASFFLPGLIHQFGNLLLTVQGHVLHLEEQGIKRMQDAVLGVVQRGGASLQVVRALLGEQTGATGSGGDLVLQVVELGRVPARECGISLETRGAPPSEAIWVAAESFVVACAETLRRWIQSVPSGSSGVATVSIDSDGAGGAMVRVGFEPAVGSLPFPMASQEVVLAVANQLEAAGGTAQVLPAPGRGIELHFAAATFVSSYEA